MNGWQVADYSHWSTIVAGKKVLGRFYGFYVDLGKHRCFVFRQILSS